jgi:hypothetical protein
MTRRSTMRATIVFVAASIVALLAAGSVLAQHGDHVVSTPDALKWVEHKASENVTVLSGVFFIGLGEKFDQGSGKELPVGGFVAVPPRHLHFAWAGGQETVVQVHGVGPTDITFVNPADDPRKKP